MKTNLTLSVVIITKDEEKNIGRCLDSVREIADEIIIIDSGSADSTKDICESYRVRFISHEWLGYAGTKNYGNSLASGDYILSLDGDEALSGELRTAIGNLKTGGEMAEAYTFNRLNNFCGKWIRHGGWYPDRKLRLWRRGLAHWEGSVHEKLVLDQPSAVRHLSGDILHYSYSNLNEYLQQMARYTDLAAEENLHHGRKASAVKLLLSPLSRFIRGYFLKAGFLDGFDGLTISILESTATYLKYFKTRQSFRGRK